MGRSYPPRPVTAVGAIVILGESVLLVRRGQAPQIGLWSLPGGGLELGESVRDGVAREVREETGLEVRVGELVEVFERVVRDPLGEVEYHYVVLDYLCEPIGGDVAAGDDADEAVWVPKGELGQRQLTAGLLPVIEKAFALRVNLNLRKQ